MALVERPAPFLLDHGWCASHWHGDRPSLRFLPADPDFSKPCLWSASS